MVEFYKMKKFIVDKLNKELSENLFYHGIDHTLKVYKATSNIAQEELISEHNTLLLTTAALYHDSGFTIRAEGHEMIGCELAISTLPNFGYKKEEIEKICGMIMATKIPQSPQNEMEEILCDADLSYIGENNYEAISSALYKELNFRGDVSEEDWFNIQIEFLENHHFFTETANKKYKKTKEINLLQLKKTKL